MQRLVTTNRIIAMDAGAAGYDRRTQFYHGRFGDGITVQIDFSVRSNRPTGKSQKLGFGNVLNNRVRNNQKK